VKDDELDGWRREWQAQPAVTMDLIRRVERETVTMRWDRLLLLAPAAVAFGTTVIAALNPRIDAIVFAAGMWIFMASSWWFLVRNRKGIWGPSSETTAAYLELSIERCRRKLKDFRFGRVLSPFITAFVLVGVWQGFASQGRLESAEGHWTLITASLFTIGVVALAMSAQNKQRKKTEAELEYLLDLQRRLKEGGR